MALRRAHGRGSARSGRAPGPERTSEPRAWPRWRAGGRRRRRGAARRPAAGASSPAAARPGTTRSKRSRIASGMKRVRGVKTWRSPWRRCWRMKKRSGWTKRQRVLGAGHRDVQQAALLLDLVGVAGREVGRDAAVGDVEHEDACPTPAPWPNGSSTGSDSPRRGGAARPRRRWPAGGSRVRSDRKRSRDGAAAASCSSCSRSPRRTRASS